MECVNITHFCNIFKTNFDYLLICINPRWPPNITILHYICSQMIYGGVWWRMDQFEYHMKYCVDDMIKMFW